MSWIASVTTLTSLSLAQQPGPASYSGAVEGRERLPRLGGRPGEEAGTGPDTRPSVTIPDSLRPSLFHYLLTLGLLSISRPSFAPLGLQPSSL